MQGEGQVCPMQLRPDTDKLEMTVKITLDRRVAGRIRQGALENDAVFFVLGLLRAQLADAFGADRCSAELTTATGQRPEFLQTMNAFACRYQTAMSELAERGEVEVDDPQLAQVFREVHHLRVTDLGGRWTITQQRRRDAAGGQMH